ncbi:hypothetical protein DVH05_001110 [Phytophthora capsici]|nr:hypothetical protein DVH05_001110 [Phytophthora capsici]
MDPMDLLTGSFRSEDDAILHQHKTSMKAEELEEKNEDNSSTSSSSDSSDEEPEQDMDFPTTQVLVQEPADEEVQEVEKPMSPAIRSPVKSHSSPAKIRSSPAKARSSPLKARLSPAKVRSSPVKARSSPAKMRSPVKARSSPVKMRSPVKIRSPVVPRSSPVKTGKPPVAPSPLIERLEETEKITDVDETPEEFRAEGPEGKFTKVFPAIAKLVENGGWQIAQGMNTLFCAMPGVQFFNFKPNINVFDSKIKACWKFIQIAGDKPVDTEDQDLWNMLWPIAQKEFGWFTMNCGPETWYVKPDTKFENFLPNETVFQNKKRAVLKCLSVEVGDIELGDSAEGHQVIAFGPRYVQPKSAPKKVKALFKTPSPAVKSIKRSTPASASSTKFLTPAKHISPGSATTGAKRKLSTSSTRLAKSSAAKKKMKGGKASAKKSTKKKNKTISDTSSEKGDDFNFTPPEFRATMGIIYSKLQDEGWYHKNGMFEYDYFSPTYTEATKELNVNYFQSQATLEDFLKVSGTWSRIENELREEHEMVVEKERELALERHHQRLEQQAARKRNQMLYGSSTTSHAPAPKPKKGKKTAPKRTTNTPPAQTLYQAELEAAEADDRESRFSRIAFGSILKKLITRGWFYRPGRFEYDYFKPSANPKTAASGEDRFESAAALEIYLKTTGLWEELAAEVEQDQYNERIAKSHESSDRPVKRSKLESPPPSSAQSPKHLAVGGVQKEDVKSITNDIWANSHEFDFNE